MRPLQKGTKICLLAIVALATAVALLAAEEDVRSTPKGVSVVEPVPIDTKSSARIDNEQNVATAEGIGRILDNTSQGKLLGRRAALTDARRNLLILRQELLGKKGNYNVSGKISQVRVHSEHSDEKFYYLKVSVPLDILMRGEIEID